MRPSLGDSASGKTTREHIVEVTDEVFCHRGFDRTSFASIAAAVHLSRANFYYHFKAKDDILDAVIDARVADTRRMLAQWEDQACDPGRGHPGQCLPRRTVHPP
ncbi:TetR/AcrR family transcriptional regulator [Nocardia pneumoniae]|uniref:TetR/AcrR family transcriptional regulator n=1 Tax=Nocardia pneumoniae TaxID=228601 RepID=UPI00031415BE|nr:TetR/AcrR family transcriptional regulator [Nocardia pneumoniae]